MSSYTQWIYHGEKTELVINKSRIGHHRDVTTTINNAGEEDEGLQDMLEDIISANIMDTDSADNYHDRATCVDTDAKGEAEKFNKLLGDAQRELYPGCSKFSTLSFIVKLLHLKVYNH